LRVAVLLDKVERRLTDVRADYVGFPIPNEFVVGYGLDYAERYRNLRDICILKLSGSRQPQPPAAGAKKSAGPRPRSSRPSRR
jgi:hypothetical protein